MTSIKGSKLRVNVKVIEKERRDTDSDIYFSPFLFFFFCIFPISGLLHLLHGTLVSVFHARMVTLLFMYVHFINLNCEDDEMFCYMIEVCASGTH